MAKPTRMKKTTTTSTAAAATTTTKTPTPKKTGGVTKVSKRLKRENKRSGLLTKLTASHEAKEEVRKAKIRSQKAIVGDMDPLLTALQDIHALTAVKSKQTDKQTDGQQGTGKKRSAREKRRMNSDLNDINLFKKVTEHEKFVQSPMSAIQDHVKYMMQMEAT